MKRRAVHRIDGLIGKEGKRCVRGDEAARLEVAERILHPAVLLIELGELAVDLAHLALHRCLLPIGRKPFKIGQRLIPLAEKTGKLGIDHDRGEATEELLIVAKGAGALKNVDGIVDPADPADQRHVVSGLCAEDAERAQIDQLLGGGKLSLMAIEHVLKTPRPFRLPVAALIFGHGQDDELRLLERADFAQLFEKGELGVERGRRLALLGEGRGCRHISACRKAER